jgi:hypothetical protein
MQILETLLPTFLRLIFLLQTFTQINGNRYHPFGYASTASILSAGPLHLKPEYSLLIQQEIHNV